MSETVSPIEQVRMKIEEMRTRVEERLGELDIPVLFPPEETESTRRMAKGGIINNVRNGKLIRQLRSRKLMTQGFTSSVLPPFNTPGLASVLLPKLRGKSIQRIRPKKMFPGVIDTNIASVERAKGAWPVSETISVEL